MGSRKASLAIRCLRCPSSIVLHFPPRLAPCSAIPGESNCACASRRGNGIMASRYSYGRGAREAKMPVFMLLVSTIIILSLFFPASCEPPTVAVIRLCILCVTHRESIKIPHLAAVVTSLVCPRGR